MSFQYACFVSYRHHEQSEIAEQFIDQLCTALRNELTLQMEEQLYVDRARMRIGTTFNEALAIALCRSVCMVMVYTPTYFSQQHPYCAREFKAMENIELARLAHLPEGDRRQHGLILPVVLRGKDSLPAALRSHRHCYDFERFSLTSRRLASNRGFEAEVRQMAEVIVQRKRLLDAVGVNMTCDCDSFTFPSEDHVRPWLESIAPRALQVAKLPFRAA
jgi:hypothetical protein